MLLGTAVADALKRVGITEERVSGWVGAPCGCKERQEKLNALDNWTRQSARMISEKAKDYLDLLLGE